MESELLVTAVDLWEFPFDFFDQNHPELVLSIDYISSDLRQTGIQPRDFDSFFNLPHPTLPQIRISHGAASCRSRTQHGAAKCINPDHPDRAGCMRIVMWVRVG